MINLVILVFAQILCGSFSEMSSCDLKPFGFFPQKVSPSLRKLKLYLSTLKVKISISADNSILKTI